MHIQIKAALLSALVFPGLGQLYKGDRLKGMILFICLNLLLLVAFYLVMRQMLPVVLSAHGEAPGELARILLDRLNSAGSPFRLLLGALGGLWLYGWIDAALVKKARE